MLHLTERGRTNFQHQGSGAINGLAIDPVSRVGYYTRVGQADIMNESLDVSGGEHGSGIFEAGTGFLTTTGSTGPKDIVIDVQGR